jgi:15-cis-phytoene synthase
LTSPASGPPGAADNGPEAFLQRSDPDRWLSSRFAADAQARRDLVTLYALDRELARIPRLVAEPLAGEIRFAWWREALEAIDAGGGASAHPVLQALAEVARRRGLKLAELEPALELHARRLDPEPFADEAAVEAWLGGAASVAAAAVRILDPAADPGKASAAAMAWTLARTDLEGRIDFPAERLDALFARLRAQAREEARGLSARAFPAVAHAALARTRSDRPEHLKARLRLVLAVITGRI